MSGRAVVGTGGDASAAKPIDIVGKCIIIRVDLAITHRICSTSMSHATRGGIPRSEIGNPYFNQPISWTFKITECVQMSEYDVLKPKA